MTLMTLPSAVNSTNYKLLPAGMYYEKRDKPVLGVVLHITAGLQDLGLVGTDESAEGTIKWALSARPQVSWHAGADSDGVELCLPDWFTAWHAAGFNSPTVGLEISKLTVDWTVGRNGITQAWVEKTLRNAARYLAAIVHKHGLPLVLQTSRDSVRSAISAGRKFGFVYHSTTSDIRSDPGKNFPIDLLFRYIREELAKINQVAPKPPVRNPVMKEISMVLVRVDGTNPVYVSDGVNRRWVQNGTHLRALQKALVAEGAKGYVTVIQANELDAFGDLVGKAPA